MKVNIKLKKLQEVLDLVSRFVSKHSTLPILENIYIKWNIDTLIFRATDMEKYVQIDMPLSIDNEWSITINARTFTDIVRLIDDEDIQLIIDSSTDTMTIKTSNDNFKIKWISANEYVAIPEVEWSNSLIVDANDFINWISKVEYAVTDKNFSPVLTGLFIRLKKYWESNKMVFVWSDSFRLSEYKINFEGSFLDMWVIIPKVHINDISKVISYYKENDWEKLKIIFSKNLISFEIELDWMKILTTSILIQGSFPNYENENVMPTKFNAKMMVDKNLLDKAIKKISILTRDMNNFISLTVSKDSLSISSWDTDKWDAKTVIPILLEWEELELWINGKYISSFLKTIDWTEAVFNFIDSEKPVVLQDKMDNEYNYVVRPLIK